MESALDPAFLERDRLRKSGIPVKIAETERLLFRETIPSDIPDLYEIWKQGGMVRGTVPVLNTLDEETEFMEAYILSLIHISIRLIQRAFRSILMHLRSC